MSISPEQQRLITNLARRGITDPRVLEALRLVPRDRFVLDEFRGSAWEDHALPIDARQTISQPYIVALMTQELKLTGSEKVLEIGTGSGYQAAILAQLCRRVITIERIPELSEKAQRVLRQLGIENVDFHIGDGTLGWRAEAPFDGILVTAGAPEMPTELYQQLAIGGRLVVPVGTGSPLTLQTIEKHAAGPLVTDVCACSFVPLIGKEGWESDPEDYDE